MGEHKLRMVWKNQYRQMPKKFEIIQKIKKANYTTKIAMTLAMTLMRKGMRLKGKTKPSLRNKIHLHPMVDTISNVHIHSISWMKNLFQFARSSTSVSELNPTNSRLSGWMKKLFQNGRRLKSWTYVRMKAKYSKVKNKLLLSAYDAGYYVYKIIKKIFTYSNIVARRAKNRPTKFPYTGIGSRERLLIPIKIS